jgi:hypothetical protein
LLTALAIPNGLQTFENFLWLWPGYLRNDFAVTHENKARPKLHPEGSSQGFALAVFNRDVLDIGKHPQHGHQLRP